jgi:recombination protein RecT
VLLLRDGRRGLEVLMTRRSLTASFAPGAYVFPGGGIDAAGCAIARPRPATRRATQSDLHLTQAIAAIRESFEELGVLLARHADGRWPTPRHRRPRPPRQPFAAAMRGARPDNWPPTTCLCWPTGSPTATCPAL